MRKLKAKLDHARDHYAKYVTSVYRAGRSHDLELLLSARSINQFYIRSAYLQRFSAQRKADIGKIRDRAREVEEVQARAQQQLTEQRRLLAEKGAEEDRLTALAGDRRGVLSKIRSDQKLLTREMDRKKAAERELEGIITRLVEAERIRRERDRREGTVEEVLPPGTGFADRKGKLRWPVREGTIVARFGTQRHPTLKTVTQNTGIEIAVKSGTPVVAVAEGEVGVIWWLPSFGNLVVLNHSQGYHTVYTHLGEISVTEGQKISEGQIIGASGESIDGPRLHFAIWKGREKLNPEPWLARK
jgi:septal ring factor EnvC (AmiA/AmiB activator)